MFLSLAIGENYIKKIFLFLIFSLWMFLLIVIIKNPKILATEKEGKKLPQLLPHLLFILFLRG